MNLDQRMVDFGCKEKLSCKIFNNHKSKWLIFTHGIGEHAGRHAYLPELFSDRFNILMYDLRGHGLSEGRRGYIDSFDQFTDDLKGLILWGQRNLNISNFYLMGHSMGALITLAYLLKEDEVPYPQKTFLSAPPVQIPGPLGSFMGWARMMVGAMSKFPLSVPLKGMVDVKGLSHDDRCVEKYKSDELVVMAPHSKLFLGLLDMANRVYQSKKQFKSPVGVAVGSKDKVISVKAIRNFFENRPMSTLKVIDGALHELHNETEEYKRPYFDFLKGLLN